MISAELTLVCCILTFLWMKGIDYTCPKIVRAEVEVSREDSDHLLVGEVSHLKHDIIWTRRLILDMRMPYIL